MWMNKNELCNHSECGDHRIGLCVCVCVVMFVAFNYHLFQELHIPSIHQIILIYIYIYTYIFTHIYRFLYTHISI